MLIGDQKVVLILIFHLILNGLPHTIHNNNFKIESRIQIQLFKL